MIMVANFNKCLAPNIITIIVIEVLSAQNENMVYRIFAKDWNSKYTVFAAQAQSFDKKLWKISPASSGLTLALSPLVSISLPFKDQPYLLCFVLMHPTMHNLNFYQLYKKKKKKTHPNSDSIPCFLPFHPNFQERYLSISIIALPLSDLPFTC